MQGLMEIPVLVPHIQPKPVILSFDSGDECSLDHWFEVYRLVEEEELLIVEAELKDLN